MVTNGSMQADAFLFDELVHDGDGVVVERPTYDRTLLSLRQRGADITAIELEDDGIDVDALEAALRGGRAPEARAHHPQLPEPRRLHAVAGQAAQAARAGPRVRLRDLRGRPLRRTSASRGESLPRMLELDEDGGSVVYASLVLEDGVPGHPRRLPRRPGRPDRPHRQAGDEHVHLAARWSPQSIVNEFCRSGAIETSIATVREALRERADALAARARARAARRALHAARRAATSSGWICPRRSTSTSSTWPRPGARRAVRQGHGLHARRRRAQRCGWPTPASRWSRSTRASAASRRRPARWSEEQHLARQRPR